MDMSMKEFLEKKICDRCNQPMTIKIMSKFNTDVICSKCKELETKHPRYKEACDAVRREEMNGNMNFEGIGKPSDL